MRPETAVVAHNGAHGPARRRLTGRGHSGLPQPGRRFPAGARHPRRRLWSLDGRRRRRPRRHIGPEPDPQHRLVDPPAHVGHPGHAGLLPRGRLCQRALLALGAAKRRGVCRVVAFAPPSPGDAGHPTPSRVVGDRLDCVCRGRAWTAVRGCCGRGRCPRGSPRAHQRQPHRRADGDRRHRQAAFLHDCGPHRWRWCPRGSSPPMSWSSRWRPLP